MIVKIIIASYLATGAFFGMIAIKSNKPEGKKEKMYLLGILIGALVAMLVWPLWIITGIIEELKK
jgi:Na+/H+ antiporter NhaD/arsenite permease-like protein